MNNQNNQPLSNLERKLTQMNAPYKVSDAYKIFGKSSNDRDQKPSVFWDPETGHISKYKACDTISVQSEAPEKEC